MTYSWFINATPRYVTQYPGHLYRLSRMRHDGHVMPVQRSPPSQLKFNMPRDVKGYLLKKKSQATEENVAHQWSEVDDLYSKR